MSSSWAADAADMAVGEVDMAVGEVDMAVGEVVGEVDKGDHDGEVPRMPLMHRYSAPPPPVGILVAETADILLQSVGLVAQAWPVATAAARMRRQHAPACPRGQYVDTVRGQQGPRISASVGNELIITRAICSRRCRDDEGCRNDFWCSRITSR